MQLSDFLTDAVLLQFDADCDTAHGIASAIHGKIQDFLPESTLQSVAVNASVGAYAYITLAKPLAIDTSILVQLEQHALPVCSSVSISRLEKVMHLQGGCTEKPQAHYAVEMDPEDGWADELFDWYDTEHLPGLASVPGTQQAWRYLNHDSGPLSLACYHLRDADVLGSPQWLKVRATSWSDRVRPHFTNTKRTMFTLL